MQRLTRSKTTGLTNISASSLTTDNPKLSRSRSSLPSPGFAHNANQPEAQKNEDVTPPSTSKPKKGKRPKSGVPRKKARVDPVSESEPEDESSTTDTAVQSTKSAANSSMVRMKVQGAAAVDEPAVKQLGGTPAHVYQAYTCMLNQTNIASNNNKFYMVQVLESDRAPHTYWAWFRWGRVGRYPGQFQLHACGSNVEQALHLFNEKFSSKTKNKWSERHNFKKVQGKYDLIQLDYSSKEDESAKETKEKAISTTSDSASSVTPKCLLEKYLQELLEQLLDVSGMESEVREMEYDASRLPLGRLTPAQIDAGYAALKRIEQLLGLSGDADSADSAADTSASSISTSASASVSTLATVSGSSAKNARSSRGSARSSGGTPRVSTSALVDACSQFYTRIPHDFGMRVPPLIRSRDEIKSKMELLEALRDIETAMRVLEEGTAEKREHPLDREYRRLECSIQLMAESDPMFQVIREYLEDSRGPTHAWYRLRLRRVFCLDKAAESAQFRSDLGNVTLLWHGTRLSNLAGILNKGLRIAPKEAPVTGYMFGKGVYFADVSSKSANYCYATRARPLQHLVLSEVALGRPVGLYEADYHADRLVSASELYLANNGPSGIWPFLASSSPDDAASAPSQPTSKARSRAAAVHAQGNSVLGIGSMATSPATHKLIDGVHVPTGKVISRDLIGTSSSPSRESASGAVAVPAGGRYSLNYNEYVVYSREQVRLRYLVETEFLFD